MGVEKPGEWRGLERDGVEGTWVAQAIAQGPSHKTVEPKM